MSNTIPQVSIVQILLTKAWIESGMMGERYVMRQHEGDAPFEYCVFNYSYAHTSNAQTMSDATAIAMSLTQERPIEHRTREHKFDAHVAAVTAAKDAQIAQLRADNTRLQNDVVMPLRERVRVLEDALTKIDAIRNDIIGRQKIGWSSHVYPLVAALDEAGYPGMEYEAARAALGDKTPNAGIQARP